MHQFTDCLPWRIRNLLFMRYLKRRSIAFFSVPNFSGQWPYINNEGTIIIGANCSFSSIRLRQCIIVRKNAALEIGDSSFVNDGVYICASRSITIGHHAKIGDMVRIYDTDFHEVTPDTPIKRMPVSIGDNVWIGANSIILAGAMIGSHSVIGAGSIVTGEIPASSLAAGSPARVIKFLNVPDGWIRK